jgi:hypothetical protein
LVQSPDLERTPYNEVLEAFTPQGRGWIELKSGMGLYIQNALFREGSTRRELADFIGVETIRYTVDATGEVVQDGRAMRIAPRPEGTPQIDQLISSRQQRLLHHRFLYQVLINPTDTRRVAMLISADSREHLLSLTEAILSGEGSVGGVPSQSYTIFPDAASVAVEMTILLDKSLTRVLWGSKLSDVTRDSRHPKLFRLYNGKQRQVQFDAGDPLSRSVPLLPGDRIER